MFCRSCGAQIPEKSETCSVCGAQQVTGVVAAAAASTAVDQNVTRQELKDRLSSVQDQMNLIAEKELFISSLYDKAVKAANKSTIKKLLKGIILVPVAVYIITLILCGITKTDISGAVMDGLALFSLIIAVAWWIYNLKVKKDTTKQIAAVSPDLETLKNDPSLSWLPYNYRDSHSYELMKGYVENMRVSNLTEAINLLETELHQQRVEEYTATAALNSTIAAINSEKAAKASSAAAANSFISLFK